MVAEVPVILGKGGVKKIIELPLTDEEKAKFHEACESIRKLVASIDPKYFKRG